MRRNIEKIFYLSDLMYFYLSHQAFFVTPFCVFIVAIGVRLDEPPIGMIGGVEQMTRDALATREAFFCRSQAKQAFCERHAQLEFADSRTARDQQSVRQTRPALPDAPEGFFLNYIQIKHLKLFLQVFSG